MLDDSTFESSEGFGGVLGTQFGNRRSTAAGGRPAFLPHPELQDDWMLVKPMYFSWFTNQYRPGSLSEECSVNAGLNPAVHTQATATFNTTPTRRNARAMRNRRITPPTGF